MNLYTTRIKAINPLTGTLESWCGPHIPAISFADAKQYCKENLGYCQVDGLLVAEIPCKDDGITPDWDKMVDYEKNGLN